MGSAAIAEGRIRLTPPLLQLSGAAWFLDKKYLASGFEMVLRPSDHRAGRPRPGADGFAFVMHNQGPNALAGRGSAGGFALGDGWQDPRFPGIPRSLAVFFDTYRNYDGYDPSDNYVAVATNGSIGKMRWPPLRLGVGRKLRVRLKDGQVHHARIRSKPPMPSPTRKCCPSRSSAPADTCASRAATPMRAAAPRAHR